MPKVLSIDDSRIMRRMIQGTAEVMGMGYLEAGCGAEGLAVLEREAADVAIICLDVNMPGMSGLEFLRKIKADDRFKHIPVMMVTSEACRTSIIDEVKSGAANYVCKPFSQEELAIKMADTLGLGVQ